MSKKRPKQPLPHFKSEDEEQQFWAKHDTADYFDWDRAERPTFPNLKPSTTSISLRIPVSMLEELKALAHTKDVPYQSLMKVFLAAQIQRARSQK